MYRKIISLMLLFGSVLCVGCGKSEPAGISAGGSPESASNELVSDTAKVVQEFLEAVRVGNTEVASKLLTPLALKRTRDLDLNFSPPGSSTAKFSVGKSESIDTQRSIVHSEWIDLDADGNPSAEQITWALKLTDGNWRISGMAAEIGENQPPVVMDFESMGGESPTEEVAGAKGQQPTGEQAPRQAQANPPAKDPFQQTVPR